MASFNFLNFFTGGNSEKFTPALKKSTNSRSSVRLSIKEADVYSRFQSDSDHNRITNAILKGQTHLTFPESEVNQWIAKKKAFDIREKDLHMTARNNTKGMELEKEGKIIEAISVYEENLRIGYPAPYSFRRLMILYRKRKDFENEERVIKAAIEILPAEQSVSFSERMNKCRALNPNYI